MTIPTTRHGTPFLYERLVGHLIFERQQTLDNGRGAVTLRCQKVNANGVDPLNSLRLSSTQMTHSTADIHDENKEQ